MVEDLPNENVLTLIGCLCDSECKSVGIEIVADIHEMMRHVKIQTEAETDKQKLMQMETLLEGYKQQLEAYKQQVATLEAAANVSSETKTL